MFKSSLCFLLKVLNFPFHMYILIPSGIYSCLKCEVGISCFHQSSRHLTNSSSLCRFVLPSLLWAKFPCVRESVVETIPSVYLPRLVQIPNSFITFRKGSFTDTWYDAILWVRYEHLQEGQCANQWQRDVHFLPRFLPICQSIEKSVDREDPVPRERSRALRASRKGKEDRFG